MVPRPESLSGTWELVRNANSLAEFQTGGAAQQSDFTSLPGEFEIYTPWRTTPVTQWSSSVAARAHSLRSFTNLRMLGPAGEVTAASVWAGPEHGYVLKAPHVILLCT